jgi:hypothetical protein
MLDFWMTFDYQKKLLWEFKFSFIIGNDAYLGTGCVQATSSLCGIMIGVTPTSYEMTLSFVL